MMRPPYTPPKPGTPTGPEPSQYPFPFIARGPSPVKRPALSVRALIADSRRSGACVRRCPQTGAVLSLTEAHSPYTRPGKLTPEQETQIVRATGRYPEALGIPANCGAQPNDVRDQNVAMGLAELGLMHGICDDNEGTAHNVAAPGMGARPMGGMLGTIPRVLRDMPRGDA